MSTENEKSLDDVDGEHQRKVKIKEISNLGITILSIILLNIFFSVMIKTNFRYLVPIMIFIFIINLMVVYLIISSMIEKRKKQEQLLYLEKNNSCLLELNDSIRSFKHDFNNIMQAIDGYIIMNDMNSLHKYFEKLLDECDHVKNLEIFASKKITNPAIYGVLLDKYRKAEKNNIKLNIDIQTDFETINERAYGVSRMLGILLDNAIEAAMECENKIVNVKIKKSENGKYKSIIIENTYKDKNIDTAKIFEKNYTTKAEKGNCGIGLWKVCCIINKDSKLELFTSADGNMFRQEIEIYRD